MAVAAPACLHGVDQAGQGAHGAVEVQIYAGFDQLGADTHHAGALIVEKRFEPLDERFPVGRAEPCGEAEKLHIPVKPPFEFGVELYCRHPGVHNNKCAAVLV